MMIFLQKYSVVAILLFCGLAPGLAQDAVDFNRDIRPILSEN